MAKKSNSVKVPDGFQRSDTRTLFFSFDTPGKIFHGNFQGRREIPDNFRPGDKQVCWICSTADETEVENKSTGEVYPVKVGGYILIPEKASMIAVGNELHKGEEIYIVYNGEKTSKKGAAFKDIEVYRREQKSGNW